jgi:lipid-A-disaccharide synthase-like uncharacterized protein
MADKWNEILSQGFTIWMAIGFLGQAVFASRFIVQWIASEIAKKSVIPIAFWYLSIIGCLLTLGYAIHRADPVFIFGYLFNCLIYFRNLYFIYTNKDEAKQG